MTTYVPIPSGETVQLSIRVPKELAESLALVAARHNVSRIHLIEMWLSRSYGEYRREVGAEITAKTPAHRAKRSKRK